MRSPIHLEPTPSKEHIIPDDLLQNVNKSHLSSITILDVICSLHTSCDHFLHFGSRSNSSEPQDISTVESVEIEYLPEFEGQLDHANLSPTDVFLEHHHYDLFSINHEIDTPSDNLSYHDTHICEYQDDILIHATNLSHTFALPQFMAQPNCENLKPTDTLSTVPTALLASSDDTFNRKCAHNLMATQCNQSQYFTSLNKICAHSPSASQNN